MIMHDITPSTPLTHEACGHLAHLIETRGRVQIDPRLFGMPARQYHVECTRCGVATPPVYSPCIAEQLWNNGESALVPLTHLPALRLAAERSLLAA
jgi:hypothetical protein